MLSLRSMKYQLQRGDGLTEGIYKTLLANQWINNNFEKLSNNQINECDVNTFDFLDSRQLNNHACSRK